jgi:hypothetical protein
MSLVVVNSTINSALYFIHPSAANHIHEGIKRYQVPLACKAAISNIMAVCQNIKQSAFLKVRGSRVEGDITREAGGCEEEAAIEVMLAILLCLRRSTTGCCCCAGGARV